MEDSRDYFERRAQEEMSAADRATDERAREAHRTMAERYREQAKSDSTGDPPSQPRPASEPAI
jgi:hypothetical protein